MPLRRPLVVLLLSLLAAAGAPAPAHASPSQISIMLDDDELLYRSDAVRDLALERMKGLGVDYARVSVLWSVVAENARSRKAARRRFRADDPSTYPVGNWDRYDRFVRAAERIGVGVYFNLTGPGPSWAHGKAPRAERANRRTWKPRPREFFKFVKAVGIRYSGTYRDENDTRLQLPRVGFWSVYNEPNHGGWLTPQYQRRSGRRIPWTPVMYRDLWYYGRAALDASGHTDDVVLIGETASLGSDGVTAKSPIRPAKFIRELFCIRPDGRRYAGRAAKARRCSQLNRLGTFRATAWAHHPYTKTVAPTRLDRSGDSITMANIAELPSLLDDMASKTARIASGLSVMLTEFGYESNPPDPFNGISPERQAAYINEGDFLAYQEPRVIGQAQLLLKDGAPARGARRGTRRYWFPYQSGLFTAGGTPKPALFAYALPLMVTAASDSVGVWGQLRFIPNGTASEVALQFREEGGTEFETVGDPVQVTTPLGFFEARRPSTVPGTWRAVWRDAGTGGAIVSREVAVR